MAEETERREGERRGKQPFLKKKVAGIPMPVILIVGGVVAIYAYKKFKGSSTGASTSSVAPAPSAPPIDTSGGMQGAGGFTGGSAGATPVDTSGLGPNTSPTNNGMFGSPTDTSQFTPPPPSSLATRNTLTVSQARARIATTERDIAAAKAMLAAAKTPAQKSAAQAKLTSAENALKTQTATLNKLLAASHG